MFLAFNSLLKELQEEVSSLCLLLMFEQNIGVIVPSKLKTLLKYYLDVALKELLFGFPPLQYI